MALVCILINAIVSSVPSVFMQRIIALVDESYLAGDWASVSGRILTYVGILVAMYILSLIAGTVYTQLMAIITQGSLKKLREKMFDHMQDLPIRYFDTHGHGDIMSYYTNDVDTLRQMISQSLPQMLISSVTLLTVFCIMMYYSVILGLIVVLGVVCMVLVRPLCHQPLFQILPPAAGHPGQCRGVYGRNDDRPEGHQGLLPRRRRQGRF